MCEPFGASQRGREADAAAAGAGGDPRRRDADRCRAVGRVGLQIVRDWVLRFNAEGPDGLVDRKAPGKAPTLTAEHRAALARAVEAGPEPWRNGVMRWRRIDLAQWLWEAFGVSVSEATVAGNSGRSATASSRRGRGTMPRNRKRRRRLKVSRSAWRRSAPRMLTPTNSPSLLAKMQSIGTVRFDRGRNLRGLVAA